MQQKVKVLLIEDNQDHIQIFQRSFNRIDLGGSLLEHETSLGAALLRLQGEVKYHVIFLDLNLPDAQGFETFLRLRSAANSIPVVILTSSIDPRIIREALSCGAQDYMSKEDLTPAGLERTIKHAMWRGQAEQNLQTKMREHELMQDKLRIVNDQLAASQREQQELLNTIDGVVWEAEIGKPTYTFISNQVEKITGYPVERWLNEVGFWKSLLHPDDRILMTGPGYRDAQQKRDSQREYRLIKANGETLWVREYIKVIEEDGIPKKMRGITVDITNRKTADEAIKKAAALKSDFLAHMSHEIRTPLNAIIGMSALATEGSLTPEQSEYIGTIKTAADLLMMLVNDVLDFSKIEAGMFQLEISSFKLADIIHKGLDVVGLTARRKNLQIETYLANDLPEFVSGDNSAISRIFLNLLGNAVKFTPENGRIDVSVKVAGQKNENEYRICFEVKDSGIGIPLDQQAKLFQPFNQGDNSMSRRYGGTGLGLSISKQLVGLMQGTIGLDSAHGQGARFFFEIPLRKAAAVEARQENDSSLPPKRLTHLHVLVAEDNVLNQRVTKRLLERLGCTFEIVMNGRRAVEAFVDRTFDLILMDCQMPEMDGYTATQTIRHIEQKEGRERTPIVALTAHAFVEDRRKCERAGMDDYLSKPVTIPQLETCIRKWTGDGKEKGEIEAMKHTGPIDNNVIQMLDQMSEESSEDLVVELIDLFQSTGQGHLDKISSAFEHMDLDDLEREAHSFKSSCRNIGAIALVAHMQHIENLAREGKQDLLRSNRDNYLVKNAEEYMRVVAELDSIRAQRLAKVA